MKDPTNLLREYSLNMTYRKDSFIEVSTSKKFDILKHNKEQGLELAILRTSSEPHYHTHPAYFCFLEDAILMLGGLDTEGNGHMTSFKASKGVIYFIPSFVLHAAGPPEGVSNVNLLIYSPSGDRARSGEYPDDTFKPENVKYHE